VLVRAASLNAFRVDGAGAGLAFEPGTEGRLVGEADDDGVRFVFTIRKNAN
jgi:hypothetical protein